jgi:hypothetical protein
MSADVEIDTGRGRSLGGLVDAVRGWAASWFAAAPETAMPAKP